MSSIIIRVIKQNMQTAQQASDCKNGSILDYHRYKLMVVKKKKLQYKNNICMFVVT